RERHAASSGKSAARESFSRHVGDKRGEADACGLGRELDDIRRQGSEGLAALLRMPVADAAIGDEFVADRVAERGIALPPLIGPKLADQAMNLLRPGRGRPINGAGLEVVVAAHAVWRSCLVGDGIAEEAARAPEGEVVGADRAVYLMCSA